MPGAKIEGDSCDAWDLKSGRIREEDEKGTMPLPNIISNLRLYYFNVSRGAREWFIVLYSYYVHIGDNCKTSRRGDKSAKLCSLYFTIMFSSNIINNLALYHINVFN